MGMDEERVEPARTPGAQEVPPAPGPAAASPRRTGLLIASAVTLAAALVYAGWRLTVRPMAQPAPSDPLAQGNYNVVLQVHAKDPSGGMAPVGTTLPRRLTLKFQNEKGQTLLENFDRVGLWAIDMPAGTYWIPLKQDELGEWKWKVAGENLARDGEKGWKFSVAAGTVNPMIELTLQ